MSQSTSAQVPNSSSNENERPESQIAASLDKGVITQLVIFVGLAVVMAAAIYFYLQLSPSLVSGKNDDVDTSTQDKKYQETKDKFSQDQQRKIDVATINSSLKAYFVENKKAPATLEEIVPEYLAKLPTDPVSKKNYTYTLSEDKKSWYVSATLSDGVAFEAEGPD